MNPLDPSEIRDNNKIRFISDLKLSFCSELKNIDTDQVVSIREILEVRSNKNRYFTLITMNEMHRKS